ncbi:phage tail protein [Vibrio metoecus]|uniref:phage tail protein n=1 Tax=Vibrio metoecus TaxID=1481663 RepID=UPI000BA99E23|nr:phage tail protein [Vibrio metoecus]PAR29565.1 phage tail protein [Vibrio metoecus]PAR61525.1 phage tail protein [Vibrio metoecus]
MHKLQNGSQVSVRPQRKPLVGLGGYFSESNDQGAPSYPGQDWFNDCTDEFINALGEMGITYDQEQLDHLARAFAAVRSQEWNALVNYGVGEQVLFSGKRYYAVQASGPDNGGEQQPDPSSVEYWFEIPSAGTRDFEFLSVPIGMEVAFDTPPPTNDARFRFVKLTYNDAYNTGLLTSQTLSGSAPELVSTAVISAAQSPINGQTIDMVNTMGTFIRPSDTSGVLQSSDNKEHGHPIQYGNFGTSSGNVSVYSRTTGTNSNTAFSGIEESRPRNISRVFYKRAY